MRKSADGMSEACQTACPMRTSAGQHLIVEKIYDKMMMRKLFSMAREENI
ncbi:hypothetical protein [Herbaspirillum lusitanum]|nr:hypothetical protein [Herbaspirillum lusitanum]